MKTLGKKENSRKYTIEAYRPACACFCDCVLKPNNTYSTRNMERTDDKLNKGGE